MFRRDFLHLFAACGCLGATQARSEQHAESNDTPTMEHTCALLPPAPEDLTDVRAFSAAFGQEDNGLGNEAGGLKSKRWNPQIPELKVLFRTESTLSDRIFEAARGWEDHMRLKFRKVTDETPDIIFDHVPNRGHWSYLGTDSGFYARQGIQTMNFGWSWTPTDSQVRRTALHEFGHAMGLVHEHSLPDNDIDWDKPAVYAYYARNYGWSRNRVDANVFAVYSEEQLNRTEYDPKSIMHYPVLAGLVTDSNDVVDWNNDLSEKDKAMAKWLWT